MPEPLISVQLTQGADGQVHVLTIASPVGQPESRVALPFTAPAERQAVAQALEAIRFELPAWQKSPAAFQALQALGLGDEGGFTRVREQVGETLFAAFFPPGGLREALRAALNAGEPKSPARVELRFGAGAVELGAYPWELLHDPARGFLFASRRAALIRYVTCELPAPRLLTLGATDALRLLLVTARPIDPTLPLLLDAERQAIEAGLAGLQAEGRIQLEELPAASPTRSTWELLSDTLATHDGAEAPHVFHFDGHGGYGRRCARPPAGCGRLNAADSIMCDGCGRRLDGPPQGYLAFEERNKRPHWVSSREVSNALADAGVRLAVLTACKSAAVGGQSVFSGMAPSLIQTGIPAVVAMQFSVTADAAKEFTRIFYLALAEAQPLTTAMGQARAALFVDETAWYRPVLYLRTDERNAEGRLFARKRPPKKPPPTPPEPVEGPTKTAPFDQLRARMSEAKPPPEPVEGPTKTPPFDQLRARTSEAKPPPEPVEGPITGPTATTALLRRILSNLKDTDAAFEIQTRRRNLLVQHVQARLGITERLSYEKFFFRYYDRLDDEERFDFQQIRGVTQGTMQARNRDTLEILNATPALLDTLPALEALRKHLVIWVNKYDQVFTTTPQMCILYAGVEDGVPFPTGIEKQIAAWLNPLAPAPVQSEPLAPIIPTPPGQPCPNAALDRRALRTALVNHFSIEGLDELCAEVQQDLKDRGIILQVNLEMVGGEGKTGKILKLIEYLDHRGYLGCLETAARRLRPGKV